jgi:hypothetical protein
MTDDWLLPLLTTEEERFEEQGSSSDDSDLSTIDDNIDRGINKYFDLNGISSMFIIKNLGSTLVFLGFIAFAYVCLLFTFLLSGVSSR